MWIAALDSPHPERLFEMLNVPFALFSSLILFTFPSGRIFEPLSISYACLYYRLAIDNRIPGLDSTH